MSNDDNKFSGLKVPPLKIILNSHQNNSVVNVANVNADDQVSQTKSTSDKVRVSISGDGSQVKAQNHDKYGNKAKLSSTKTESKTAEIVTRNHIVLESSSPSSSDRSSSSTPSTESESSASNSTLISNQQIIFKHNQPRDGGTSTTHAHHSNNLLTKPTRGRHENSDKCVSGSSSTLGINNSSSFRTRFSNNELNKGEGQASNQRITRSSQRAAQQSNRDEGTQEQNSSNEETNSVEQEKNLENIRKAKRRKCDVSESEQDNNQANSASVLALFTLPPEHYKPPSQNSFELFRDIKKKLDSKMRGLSSIHPKMPLGFQDYLLHSGPYLLEGNKLGYGMNGSNLKDTKTISNKLSFKENRIGGKTRNETKILNDISSNKGLQSTLQKHSSYEVPKMKEVPSSIGENSPLRSLFVEQEKNRHKMRMDHIKERERWTLSTEQEILRVYNQAAMSEANQSETLSVCTLLYYQENYHYSKDDNQNSSATQQNQDMISGCTQDCTSATQQCNSQSTTITTDVDSLELKSVKKQDSGFDMENFPHTPSVASHNLGNSESTELLGAGITVVTHEINDNFNKEATNSAVASVSSSQDSGVAAEMEVVPKLDDEQLAKTKLDHSMSVILNNCKDYRSSADRNGPSIVISNKEQIGDQFGNFISEHHILTDEERKIHNKNVFLEELQKTDDKWAKIEEEMLIRHKNESDSLHAVQMLEWEWKIKEIGACDVRVTPKIGLDCVPKVEVAFLDY